MTFVINTNSSASLARFNLGQNNQNLRKSMTRLSSGQKIVNPRDDAGGFAVATKLEGSVARSEKVLHNISNAMSFLEVQDGILEGAGSIIDRMSELKSLYNDVIMSSADKENYDKEFRGLQVQLYNLSQVKYNGISLCARFTEKNGSTDTLFEGTVSQSNKIMVQMNPSGDESVVASISKSSLLSAVTIHATTLEAVSYGDADPSALKFRLANSTTTGTGAERVIQLSEISVGVIAQALENVETLRAENGAVMSQLRNGYENLSSQKTNMRQGYSRIMDVDIASESTRLAKYNVLTQSSASMLAQANTLSEVALILMR